MAETRWREKEKSFAKTLQKQPLRQHDSQQAALDNTGLFVHVCVSHTLFTLTSTFSSQHSTFQLNMRFNLSNGQKLLLAHVSIAALQSAPEIKVKS